MHRRQTNVRRGAFTTLLIGGLLATITSPTMSAEPDQGAPGDWLTRYAGARTVGLGGAFVAVADEAGGAVWNPAGIRWLDRNELQGNSVRLFDDTTVNGLSFALPLSGRTTAGATLLTLGSGGFERTNELNESLGEFSADDTAFLLSAAYGMTPRLALGANLKVLHHAIEEFSATGVGADLGAQYVVTDDLRLGAAILNVGGPTLTLREQDETVPTEVRGGLALQVLGDAGLLSAEVSQRDGWGSLLRAGAEVWLLSRFALRLGYADDNVAGGVGYRLPQGWQFDYGASDHELGVVHRFGLSVRFGGYQASSQATPEVFSPTGTQPVTKFVLHSRTKSDASDWKLVIADADGAVVRTFGGRGSTPAHVLWDGKDSSGLPLPDGLYRYRLTVHDDAGREFAGVERTVEISTGGPDISVPVEVH
ncbi:MAG TPA: PorV/PorQ family protein [Candidatus Krumholzibacteria bacterium]|nr:PorV/PorQ family protein [Candidatus Krumholzibacteria bacterium]HPD70473.1 PorV/PorQ family protein [Candidatus Krumholzibacteria bacterium]HRY39827.1 PorV/PorQ family protein [Candidatus Krumholzibacteria bacterium]